MPKKTTPKFQTRTGAQSIFLEEPLATPLKEFGKRCRLSGAEVARVILAFGLPKLTSGEFSIVNGELVPTKE